MNEIDLPLENTDYEALDNISNIERSIFTYFRNELNEFVENGINEAVTLCKSTEFNEDFVIRKKEVEYLHSLPVPDRNDALLFAISNNKKVSLDYLISITEKKFENYIVKRFKKATQIEEEIRKDAEDVFHEALLKVFRNYKRNNITATTYCENYIFEIAKNTWLERYRPGKLKQSKKNITQDEYKVQVDEINPTVSPKNKGILRNEDGYVVEETIGYDPFGDDINDPEFISIEKKVHKILDSLSEACRKLFEKFYFDNKSLKEIAEDLGYSSEGSAKTQKNKCIKRIQSHMI